MWKFFSRLNPHVQSVSGWLTIGGAIMTGAYALLARAAPLFGHRNWAEDILIGIALTLATGLLGSVLLAVGAYGFRLIRPLSSFTPRPQTEGAANPAYDDAPLRAKIDNLTNALAEADKLGKQNEAGLLGAMAIMERIQKFAISEAQELRAGAVAALKEQRDFQERMETWVGKLRNDVERRLGWIDQGFAAIGHRERMAELAREIDEGAGWLCRPERGEKVEDWGRWNVRQQQWKDLLARWVELAEIYRHGVGERVNRVSQADVETGWQEPDDMFPNSNAIFAYRHVSVSYRNFTAEWEEVQKSVRMAAFASPSMKGRADG
jgi:hypothetical protein